MPTDFKPDLPANSELAPHGPELRARIGLIEHGPRVLPLVDDPEAGAEDKPF